MIITLGTCRPPLADSLASSGGSVVFKTPAGSGHSVIECY